MIVKDFTRSKKGMAQTWWIISTAVIALVLVVLIIIWFQGSGDKAFGSLGDQIDDLEDCDNDGVANMFDKCPCKDYGDEENPDFKGCPNGQSESCQDSELKTLCDAKE